MNNSFSFALKLNDGTNLDRLVDIIKQYASSSVLVSTNQKEHEIEGNFPNSIFITHYNLSTYENIVLYSMIYKILSKYSTKVKNLLDKKYYHTVYSSEDYYFFLIPSSSYDDDIMVDFLYETKTGRLINDEEWDDLELKSEENESIMDIYTYCDYLPIIDTPEYLEKKPKFITYFWNKRKVSYESETKKAFELLHTIYTKI